MNTGQLKRVVTNVLLAQDDSLAYCGTQSGDMLEVNLERAIYKRLGPGKSCFSLGITCSALLDCGKKFIMYLGSNPSYVIFSQHERIFTFKNTEL